MNIFTMVECLLNMSKLMMKCKHMQILIEM